LYLLDSEVCTACSAYNILIPFETLRLIQVRRCAIDWRDTITLLSDRLFSTLWVEIFQY